VLVEEAAGKEEVGRTQDTDMVEVSDKDRDVEAEAAGSYLLEDQDGSDRPGERGPGNKLVPFSKSGCRAICNHLPDTEDGEEDNVLEDDAMMTETDIDLMASGHLGSVQVFLDHSGIGLAWELLANCNHFGHLQVVEGVNPVVVVEEEEEEEEDNSFPAAGHLVEVDMRSDDPLLPSSCSNIIG
jgi:hypothetical protein